MFLALLSKNNVVIYCTHSHYLLDPDRIPLSLIKIATKSARGTIELQSIYDYQPRNAEKRTAFQPIIDALHIKPFITDYTYSNICVVEGIYDYYFWEIMKPKDSRIKFMPATSATDIRYFVSIAVAWQLNYVAMWDNDDEGQKEHTLATKKFGQNEARRFLLLPTLRKRRKFILEDILTQADMGRMREIMQLPSNASFERTISTAFFSDCRTELLQSLSDESKCNIKHVLDAILLTMFPVQTGSQSAETISPPNG